MRTRVLLLALLLAVAIALPAGAQEIYLRNRPYKGPKSGRGAAVMVGLREIAQAFDLKVEEAEGRFYVGAPPEGGAAGDVYVEGTKVACAPGTDGPLVNLKEFSEAAGLTYKYDKAMDSIDVVAGQKRQTAGPAGVGETAASGAILINEKSPGALVDLNAFLVRGKYNLVLLYTRQIKDEGYRKTYTAMDVFTKYPDLQVIKVNMGDREKSPIAQKYPGMVPRVIVLNRALQRVEEWNGHSILSKCADPEAALASVRSR